MNITQRQLNSLSNSFSDFFTQFYGRSCSWLPGRFFTERDVPQAIYLLVLEFNTNQMLDVYHCKDILSLRSVIYLSTENVQRKALGLDLTHLYDLFRAVELEYEL